MIFPVTNPPLDSNTSYPAEIARYRKNWSDGQERQNQTKHGRETSTRKTGDFIQCYFQLKAKIKADTTRHKGCEGCKEDTEEGWVKWNFLWHASNACHPSLPQSNPKVHKALPSPFSIVFTHFSSPAQLSPPFRQCITVFVGQQGVNKRKDTGLLLASINASIINNERLN